MHWGTAAGLPTTEIGQAQGQANVTLTTAQLPAHTHTATAAKGTAVTTSPSSTSFLGESVPSAVWQKTPTIGPQFAANAISLVGGNIPHDNMQPFLVLNFCICFNGYFPSRG
jgi:microcystin-dependent protein